MDAMKILKLLHALSHADKRTHCNVPYSFDFAPSSVSHINHTQCKIQVSVTFALEAGTMEVLAHDLRTTSRCAELGREDSTTTRSDGGGCASSLCCNWHDGEVTVVLSPGEIKSTTDRVWFWGHTIAEREKEPFAKVVSVHICFLGW